MAYDLDDLYVYLISYEDFFDVKSSIILHYMSTPVSTMNSNVSVLPCAVPLILAPRYGVISYLFRFLTLSTMYDLPEYPVVPRLFNFVAYRRKCLL